MRGTDSKGVREEEGVFRTFRLVGQEFVCPGRGDGRLLFINLELALHRGEGRDGEG